MGTIATRLVGEGWDEARARSLEEDFLELIPYVGHRVKVPRGLTKRAGSTVLDILSVDPDGLIVRHKEGGDTFIASALGVERTFGGTISGAD